MKIKNPTNLFPYTVEQMKALLDKALSIQDDSDYALDKEIKGHSKAHAEWSALSAKALKLYRLKELELKKLTAEIITEIRLRAKEDGKPLAVTAPIEKEMVPNDIRWQKAYEEYINLGEYVSILSSVERAFQNRAWLLIQLSKGREGTFEPTVKGKKRGYDNKPVELEEYEL